VGQWEGGGAPPLDTVQPQPVVLGANGIAFRRSENRYYFGEGKTFKKKKQHLNSKKKLSFRSRKKTNKHF